MENIIKVAGGEYSVYYLTDAANLYSIVWDNTLYVNKAEVILPSVKDVTGGLHSGAAVDTSGNVWTFGDNTYGQQGSGVLGGTGANYKILTDINGNSFIGVSKIVGWFATNIALKADGTVWIWGQDYLNINKGANILKPTPLPLPSGVTFQKIVGQLPLLGLDTTGGVWEWKSGSTAPSKVALPAAASDIAGQGTGGSSFAIVGGYPYGWCEGFGGGAWKITSTVPIPLRSQWGVNTPITSIVGNDNTIHYIDANGALWGLGDNAMGEVGNGQEINFSVPTTINPLPYTWSWSTFQKMVTLPIQILPGTKFKQICTQSSYVFYVYAEDASGNWYSWGRNKGMVLGNGISIGGDMGSNYPNIADQPTPAICTPLTASFPNLSSFPQAQALYAKNTGYPIPVTGTTTTTTTTTTSTTKPTTTTSTTSTTTSTSTTKATTTTSTTTTTTTTRVPYIILYKDGTWSPY